MKKLLTIALAIICMAVLTGLAAGQGAQQKDKPKSPPTSGATKPAPTSPPAPSAKNSAHATEQVMTGTVTKVNDKAQTFAVTANGKEVLFSGKNLKAPFPKVGDFVDVTYTPPPKPGDPPAARLFIYYNERDIEYTPPPKPGDPPAATTIHGTKSKGDARVPRTENQMVTGTVTNVDEKAQTFTVKTAKGERLTFSFSATEMPPPKKGYFTMPYQMKKDEQVDVTYIQQTPGGPMVATAVEGSKSNTYRVADDPPKVVTGKVLRVSAKDKTFTVMAKGKEVTFSTEKLKGPPPEVGKIYDITYTPNPGGANWSINLNSSRSNIY